MYRRWKCNIFSSEKTWKYISNFQLGKTLKKLSVAYLASLRRIYIWIQKRHSSYKMCHAVGRINKRCWVRRYFVEQSAINTWYYTNMIWSMLLKWSESFHLGLYCWARINYLKRFACFGSLSFCVLFQSSYPDTWKRLVYFLLSHCHFHSFLLCSQFTPCLAITGKHDGHPEWDFSWDYDFYNQQWISSIKGHINLKTSQPVYTVYMTLQKQTIRFITQTLSA